MVPCSQPEARNIAQPCPPIRHRSMRKLFFSLRCIENQPHLRGSPLHVPIVFNEGSSFYRVIITNVGNKGDAASADRLWEAYKSLYAMHERARIDGRGVVAYEDYSHNVKTAGQKAENSGSRNPRTRHPGRTGRASEPQLLRTRKPRFAIRISPILSNGLLLPLPRQQYR